MLRLSILLSFLTIVSTCFAQKTIKKISYQQFLSHLESVDTFFIDNSSITSTNWEKDQVGITQPFKGKVLKKKNWTNTKKYSYYSCAIKNQQADGTILYFDEFFIPKGGKLYLLSARSHRLLTFDDTDNIEGGSFSTLEIEDSLLSFIYQGPLNSKKPIFKLREVGVLKNTKKDTHKKAFGSAGSCLINVNCSEGDQWKNQKRSVVRILTKVSSSIYTCSGTLVNNTAEDCTPYVITAEHCANIPNTNTYSTANDLESWQFYFNYESSTCDTPDSEDAINSQTITGATFIAQSHDMGGDFGSDFFLVKLHKNIPNSYNAYFSGWNNENKPSSSGVSIHHPKNDIKKISTFTTLITSDYSAAVENPTPDAHWKVQWAATTNGHSITEGGSSGGPLFDSNGLLIGNLNGGQASCNDLEKPDWYGKLSYSWNSNGKTDNLQLKPHLDPLNLGLTTLQGKNNLLIDKLPTVTISASKQNVCDNENITFSITQLENQGEQPTYKWLVNDIIVSEKNSYTNNNLRKGDIVTCQLTSSIKCIPNNHVFSNEIIMDLKTTYQTNAIIHTNSAELCPNESVTFVISQQTGQGTYQWYLNDTLTSVNSTFSSDTLETNDQIHLLLNSNEECNTSESANSNYIKMTVEDSITPTIQINLVNETLPLCTISSASIQALTTGSGQTGIVEWFINNEYEGDGLELILLEAINNDTIHATLNSSLICSTDLEVFSKPITVTTTICTGISTSEERNDISIYPNPFNNEVYISGNNIQKISFINSIGIPVLVSKYIEVINCSHLTSGVYTIIIQTNNQQQTKKLIKK
jgi:hypothetical protein